MKKTAGKKLLYVILAITVILFLALAFSHKLTVRRFTEKTDKVTGNVKIMVLSDLKNAIYGKNQEQLIELTEREAPNALLFIGDIEDKKEQRANSLELFETLAENYPCYYVSGENDIISGKIDDTKKELHDLGVTVLDGASDTVMAGNQYIRICGVDDSSVGEEVWNEQLTKCEENCSDNVYTIFMTNRPEQNLRYHNYDLIVSGNTCGGYFRIPGILNGIYAENQGIFPKFSGGEYDIDGKNMIVSRGLAKKGVFRFFAPPEIVIVDIGE